MTRAAAALSTFFVATSILAQQLDQSTEENLRQLQSANYFSVGSTGVGGMQNPAQIALLKLSQRIDAQQILKNSFEKGTIATKLYVACWASTYDKAYFSSIYDELMGGKSQEVTTIQGSILSKRKLGDVLDSMKSGECGRLVIGG